MKPLAPLLAAAMLTACASTGPYSNGSTVTSRKGDTVVVLKGLPDRIAVTNGNERFDCVAKESSARFGKLNDAIEGLLLKGVPVDVVAAGSRAGFTCTAV